MSEVGSKLGKAANVYSRYKRGSLEEREKILGIALILPSLLLITLVILYPLLFNIYLSFYDVPLNPSEPVQWNNFGHYKWLLTSSEFWHSLQVTIIFSVGSTTLATVGGVAVTELLRHKFRGRRFIRGLILLPYVAPIIAVAFTWRWMFNAVYGIIPKMLGQLGFTGLSQMSLLSESGTALWLVIIFDGWRYFPFAFLLIIARVQSIPSEMYEAAEIDGASKFAQFKDITLPELRHVIATVILLRLIWNFNKYTDVWLVTHNVDVLSVFTYQTAFNTLLQGRAASISMVLFVFLMLFSLVYVKWVIKW